MFKYELLIDQAKKIYPRVAVEVGCMPFPIYDERTLKYGASTTNLAGYLATIQCTFYSIDINLDHCISTIKLCTQRRIPICVVHGDATILLPKLKELIDFLYLDGSDDPNETLEQFKTVEGFLTPSAVTIIDDCLDYNNNLLGKGTLLIPYLKEKNYSVQIEDVFSGTMAICKLKIT